MRKICILLILSITTIALLTGCKPKGEPMQPITAYYQNIKDGNIEGAYEQLAEANKKNFTKEDFIKFQETNAELMTLKDFKIEIFEEYKNKDIEGTVYKNVVEFTVVETVQHLYADKEQPINYKRSVVNDNGVWKLLRDKMNPKEAIANNLNNIAWMYIDGKGKTNNLNQAITVLNEALKYDKNFAPLYYALGVCYQDLNRNDEALTAINTYLTKDTDKTQKSDGYNVLGNIYSNKENIDKSKESYEKAIEFNPDNQYAKTNLEQLK